MECEAQPDADLLSSDPPSSRTRGLLLGIGVGISLPACNTAGPSAVDPERAGMGSGLMQMLFNIPAALGVGLVTSIIGTLTARKILNVVGGAAPADHGPGEDRPGQCDRGQHQQRGRDRTRGGAGDGVLDGVDRVLRQSRQQPVGPTYIAVLNRVGVLRSGVPQFGAQPGSVIQTEARCGGTRGCFE